MYEFDLNTFKKTWQQQALQPEYDIDKILKMLNRKSRNYVKYIFWISVAEFLLFSVLGLVYFFQEEKAGSFRKMLEILGAKESTKLEAGFGNIYLTLKILSLLLTAYFVLRFYQNYCKIKIEQSLKEFITRIIKFKKTVSSFIIISLFLLGAFIIVLAAFLSYVVNSQNIQPARSNLIVIIIAMAVSTLFALLLIGLYYRLVYGRILKNLEKNLKQLKQIDSHQNL